MVSWSSFVRPALTLTQCRSVLQSPACKNALQMQLRQMSGHGHGHHLTITPSRYQWNKFKDLLHFYAMIGLIPVFAVTMYANIFVGPAQLTEIPADYVPKAWEYHKNPISRFIARMYPSPQQEYEKALHYLFEENEKAQLRQLEKDIRQKMADRNDYQAYYYRPAIAKYHRISKEAADHLESLRGN